MGQGIDLYAFKLNMCFFQFSMAVSRSTTVLEAVNIMSHSMSINPLNVRLKYSFTSIYLSYRQSCLLSVKLMTTFKSWNPTILYWLTTEIANCSLLKWTIIRTLPSSSLSSNHFFSSLINIFLQKPTNIWSSCLNPHDFLG